VEAVKILLNAGADVEGTGVNKTPPLQEASKTDNN